MNLRALALAGLALAGLTLCSATDARAQWSAPAFLPPHPGDDIGIYVSSVGNFGIQGIWRQHGNLNLGVRGGYIDSDTHGGVVVAAESWGLLFRAGQGLPVDAAWTVGAGAVFNSGTWLEVPVGLSIGWTVPLAGLAVQFYGHPRLALVVIAGDDEVEDATEAAGLFDLGADVATTGGLKLRLSTTLGRFEALGLGVAIPWGRGVAVR
jgi:hypothetical protein